MLRIVMAGSSVVGRVRVERESLLYDIGIITGFMATNYAVIRAAPHMGPVTASLLGRVGVL